MALPRTYEVYGLRIRSTIPLPCLTPTKPGPAEVEVVNGSASLFARIPGTIRSAGREMSWLRQAPLANGSHYLRWSRLIEFLITPDGRRVFCRSLDGAAPEAFQTYLLGQVLSFALLKREIESLHSTAVVVDGGAACFIGDCGYGKSSLGAAFLQAGHLLLTDDLLVVREEGDGFVAYPGPPRIKLFPEIARSLLGERVTGAPMNALTSKLVIPVEQKMFWRAPAPLRAIYVLTPPFRRSASDRITIRPLSPRRAFLELLRNTFNPLILEQARLTRLFDVAVQLAREIPVRSLSFPRKLARLPAVRAAIQSDLTA